MTETRDSLTAERDRPGREPQKRRGLFARMALFVRQVVAELRKVVRPTRQQLLTYWAVVLIFVVVVIAIVSVLDLGIGWLTFRIFA